MSNLWELKLKPWQWDFVYPQDQYKFLFLKSAWATGKSLALILAGVNESEKYPGNLGVIFRKEYVDLRDSTCKDFESYTGMAISSSRDAKFPNGSVILFRHLEEMNNIQNMNLGWFGIEQGEELETDEQFYTLFGRLRRAESSRRGYIIANAKGHNWIYKLKQSGLYAPDDVDRKRRLDLHLSASTFENKDNLSPDYLMSLEVLKTQKPALYARFVMNSDEDEDAVDLIIRPEWIREAVNKELPRKVLEKRVVVVDPARFGDDETVSYQMEGNKALPGEIYGQKSTMETAGRLILQRKKSQAWGIAGDDCGVGGGVFDRLEEMGERIIKINSASRSEFPDKYKNLRAEMWAVAAEKFEKGSVSIPNDPVLIEQLGMVRYKTIESSGKLQVESKEDIKKRLGRSPDRADCVVMGLWAVDKVEAKINRERKEQDLEVSGHSHFRRH